MFGNTSTCTVGQSRNLSRRSWPRCIPGRWVLGTPITYYPFLWQKEFYRVFSLLWSRCPTTPQFVSALSLCPRANAGIGSCGTLSHFHSTHSYDYVAFWTAAGLGCSNCWLLNDLWLCQDCGVAAGGESEVILEAQIFGVESPLVLLATLSWYPRFS